MRYSLSIRTFLSFTACLLAAALSGCNAGTDGEEGPDPQASPEVLVTVKHLHFPAANYDGVLKDDVPKPVRIELNGIPGGFDGIPTEDALFDTILVDDSPFRLPWERLLQVPTTQPEPYLGGMLVESVTPAATRIMRMGTFADGVDDDAVFPDSLFEAYGLYDTALKVGVTAVYFSGPATIRADREYCNSMHAKFDVDIPGAGFWFLTNSRSGNEMRVSLLRDTRNLVFSVNTFSQASYDFLMSELENLQGCLDPVEKAGAGKRLTDWLGLFPQARK